MPQGYCKECRAHVTIRDGACLLGHSVDPATIVAGNGRHRAPRSRSLIHSQLIAPRGAIGVDSLPSDQGGESSEPPLPRITARQIEPRPRPIEAPSATAVDPVHTPEPFQRPLLGRRKMPMLELLGFADPDERSATSLTEPLSTPLAPRPASRPNGDKRPILQSTVQIPTPGPRLADVHQGESTENTGVLVARLWEATSEHSPLGDDWKPTQAVEAPNRSYRWSLISAALALTVTIALLAVAAYRLPINQASALRDNLTSSYLSLDAAAERIPGVAELILNPDTISSQFADAAIPLLALSEAANSAYASTTADAGSDIPFVSKEPLEALEPAESSLRRAADEALVIHERIGDVLDYRILLERALVLPASLPVQASDAQISDIGVSLSDTLAETTEVLLQLPRDQILAGHQLQLEKAFAEMSIHVADYLAALRSDNSFAASRIAAEMRSTAAITKSIDATLTGFEAWLLDASENLEQQLDVAAVALQATGS